MDINNLILALIDDDNIIEQNVVRYIVEDLENPLPDIFNIRRGERQKNENFYERIVLLYDDGVFKEHFRMSRAAVEELVNIVGHAMVENQNHPVELQKKILFTIWILAKQESYLAAGDRFGLSKSTDHGILKEIVFVLVQLIPNYIVWPNREMCNRSSTIFQRRSGGFPGVVGAIDGTHIPCKAPPGNANDYYNRKGFHSIILQGVCDHTGRFINIFVGLPGRMHDARVFRYSDLYRQLTNEEVPLLPPQIHLIGDAAYPLLRNLMTPFKDTGHMTIEQIIYNTRLSSIRSIIERAFGLLKGKLRRLHYLDISDFELGQNMIAASCVLHNFMINRGEVNFEQDMEVENDLMLLRNGDDPHEHQGRNAAAVAKRNDIMYLLR